nr:MAG: hypothetical protein E4H34_00370 [Hyphomicrobiales bacterium]
MHAGNVIKFAGLASLLAGLVMGSAAAFAHHSFAMFDRDKEMTVTGRVLRVDYANPHVWLTITVVNANNEEEEWALEGGNLMGLYRAGWYKDTVKPGNEVTVALHPRADGDPGGSIMSVTQADGNVLRSGG